MLHADNVTFDPECGNKHYYINDKRIEFGIIVEAIERLLNALKFKCKIQTPQVCTGVCVWCPYLPHVSAKQQLINTGL